MRFGVTLPPFNEWADPRTIMAMAAEAEAAGWDGFFLWDHISWNPAWGGTPSIADPWICLAAAAMTTATVRLGPLVARVSPPLRRQRLHARPPPRRATPSRLRILSTSTPTPNGSTAVSSHTPLAHALDGWAPGATHSSRRVDPWPAAAFAALLDTGPPPLRPGDPLPPLWHWFTLLEHPEQAELGADGHPAHGHFLPPIPHRRRMFAGGRYRLHRPILIGDDLACRSTVAQVSVKQGRSGELAFVTVRHELSVDGTPVGVEEQDIVYRSQTDGTARTQAAAAPDAAPSPSEWRLTLPTDPVLLFRFSALTYNGHRIHYDTPYATGVEGHPGLVVHGPLLALLALELPRRQAPTETVTRFAYRLVRPAFAGAVIEATGRRHDTELDLTVDAEHADASLTATATLGPNPTA